MQRLHDQIGVDSYDRLRGSETRRRVKIVRQATGLGTLALSQRMLRDPGATNNVVWLIEKGQRNIVLEDLWSLAYAAQGMNLLHDTTATEIVAYVSTVADNLPMSAPDSGDQILDNGLRMEWEKWVARDSNPEPTD